jgi:hypothetical protein
VSEWAARCSTCGTATDDATFVQNAPSVTDLPSPTDGGELIVEAGSDMPSNAVIAQDATPRHLPPARLAGSLRVLLIFGLVMPGTLVAVLLRLGTPARGHIPGFVLSVGADGRFEISAPDGRDAAPALGHGPTHDAAQVVLATDDRYLVTQTGKLMLLRGDGVFFTGDAIPLRPGQSITALADHNRAVITIGGGDAATYPVYATRFGKPPMGLGEADSVAGDPQQTGVIVSVGSTQLPNGETALPGGNLAFPLMDDRVELRDAGHHTVLLDRADQLNLALHQPPSTPIQIVAVPSPSGQLLALEVTPASFDPPWKGVVVVDRHGSILGTAAGLNGTVSWSPDSQRLAYLQIAAGHLDIAIWTMGHQPELHQGPITVVGSPVTCVWAPTGRAVLCALNGSHTHRSATWLVAQRHRFHVATYTGPFLPLAWLAGPTPKPDHPAA